MRKHLLCQLKEHTSAGRSEQVGNDELGIEFEVELPRSALIWLVPIFVCQRDSDLDDLQEVHITPQRLIMVI